MTRKASFAGSFYPNSKEQLEVLFNNFDSLAKDFSLTKDIPKAIIVPHAGYIYSGFTAFLAYKNLERQNYENIVVLGPSHKFAFNGLSAFDFKYYETPFGNLNFSNQMFQNIEKKLLTNEPLFHTEHSTEVQFPFIKYFLNLPILEIIYSRISYESLAEILDTVYKIPKTLIIISTDLSHFYEESFANEIDLKTIKAIENFDLKTLEDKNCEACGKIGVLALIKLAKKYDLSLESLEYATSSRVSCDSSKVVGYYSALMF